MKKSVVLTVKFEWKDVRKAKDFGELYEEIGLKDLIEHSIENPEETGGEIIKANIHATSHVMAKIAAIFSSNMLREYTKQLEEEHEDDMDDKIELQDILEHVGQYEYALGFDAGVIGPELTNFKTPTLKVIAASEENISESDPVFYVFQKGTEEYVEPRNGEAAEFLSRIEAMSGAIDKADKIANILKK